MKIAVLMDAPLRATLTLRGETKPTWNFAAKTEALDLSLLGVMEDSTPVAFDLVAKGAGGAADLQGSVQQGDIAVVIEPSHARIDGELLTVEPLAIRAFDGYASLRGRADFTVPENPEFRFAVNARGLRWGTEADSMIGAEGDFGLAGKREAWAAIGKATLTRGEDSALLEFDGRGNAERVRLQTLRATMPTGTLDATGTVGWSPVLDWDAKGTLAGPQSPVFSPRDGTAASPATSLPRGASVRTACSRARWTCRSSPAACATDRWTRAARSRWTATTARAISRSRWAAVGSPPRARSATRWTWTRISVR